MTYVRKMPTRLLRGFLTLLILSAYLGATVHAIAPTAYAASADMSHGMMHEPGGMGDKMPCKGTMPTCMTGLGCALMVSVPAPELVAPTSIAWSRVTYSGSLDLRHGRTIRPTLDPPRSHA